MTAMQKSIVWVATDWVESRYQNPGVQDCLSAVHEVIQTVLFRATLEDERVAIHALLERYGHA
jgi:hypothetical protein